jgi:2-polyprenyl-3-methyl-5-hydroxy-6-metoxy-1,4-benzoquinol methylase
MLSDQELEPWYRARYHGWWQAANNHLFNQASKLFSSMRRRWISRFIDSGIILDVGCGDGSFADYMKSKGWEVFGVENLEKFNPGKNFRVIRHDTPKWQDLLPEVDIITLWHVLEHIDNPLQMLHQAHGVLKPSGYLIISVPNINSLQSVLCRDKWFHLDVPRHRWHFTPETLSLMLGHCGFTIIDLSHISWEYSPFGWWQSLLNVCGGTYNFIYNIFKRRELPVYENFMSQIFDIVKSIFCGIMFIPVVVVLSFIEILISRGGSITVTARKR